MVCHLTEIALVLHLRAPAVGLCGRRQPVGLPGLLLPSQFRISRVRCPAATGVPFSSKPEAPESWLWPVFRVSGRGCSWLRPQSNGSDNLVVYPDDLGRWSRGARNVCLRRHSILPFRQVHVTSDVGAPPCPIRVTQPESRVCNGQSINQGLEETDIAAHRRLRDQSTVTLSAMLRIGDILLPLHSAIIRFMGLRSNALLRLAMKKSIKYASLPILM
jgi:hypothetical protein